VIFTRNGGGLGFVVVLGGGGGRGVAG